MSLLLLGVVLFLTGCQPGQLGGGGAARVDHWPPEVGKSYPDLAVINHRGERFMLSSLKGKVVIVEPIGMSCTACQAFAGGNKVGGFQGVTPQRGLGSLEELVKQYSWGVSLSSDKVAVVQLLLYDPALNAPTVESARLWAEHFGIDKRPNWHVVVPDGDLRNDASYQMIPGFQLVDKKFVLRLDSSGHNPQNNLFKELIPSIAKLIRE
jgi:hypothetical protein